MDLGASLKLLGNSIILGAVQLYAESYALSDAIGFDPAVFHELHRGSHGVSVEHQLT
jgi:3-hydroxyisobutyrate dehydrogenase-like beta-hydroxyacid dehydrogenase